jgi:hypothetical protein
MGFLASGHSSSIIITEGFYSIMFTRDYPPMTPGLRAVPGFVYRTAPIPGVAGRSASVDADSRREAP